MKPNYYGKRNPADKATPGQVSAIKMGQKALGISDEDYRATLWGRYGAESCTELTQKQASDLIEDYVSRGFVLIQPAAKAKRQKQARPPRPAGRGKGNVIPLASADEIDKINQVAALIPWRAENGLALFLAQRMGIKEGRVRTAQEAYLAIEGLKKMFEHGMKKAHGPAWWRMTFADQRVMEYIRCHCPEQWK